MSPSSLMLCHYLTPQLIVLDPGASQKETLINHLIERVFQVSGFTDLEMLKNAVWEREGEGRTVLENGLAIPHARIPGLPEIKACLGISPKGYRDPQEGVLVHLVFLFLSPQEQFRVHLQMLAKISRVFQDAHFIEELIRATRPEEAFALIQRKERG